MVAQKMSNVKKYRVIINSEEFNDWGAGQCHEEILGEYATLQEANDAAREHMMYSDYFRGWADKYYCDKPPPYCSWNIPDECKWEDYDGSSEEIHVVDICAHEEVKKNGEDWRFCLNTDANPVKDRRVNE